MVFRFGPFIRRWAVVVFRFGPITRRRGVGGFRFGPVIRWWAVVVHRSPGVAIRSPNNNIYLVRPPRGGWLHRRSRLGVACMPVVPLGSLTPCSVTPSLIAQ
jgi:hypothetical protein